MRPCGRGAIGADLDYYAQLIKLSGKELATGELLNSKLLQILILILISLLLTGLLSRVPEGVAREKAHALKKTACWK